MSETQLIKYNIIRGKNQIGENIIEIFTEKTKILVDVGLELLPYNKIQKPLSCLIKNEKYDAVLISHYHDDHIGLIYELDSSIPIYLGEKTYKIINSIKTYKNETFLKNTNIFFIRDMCSFFIKDIKITPFLCDHSAYDSYMFLFEKDNYKIFYTGDFRSNGRKSYDLLLKKLDFQVDVLICEGTNLSRETNKNIKENELENIYKEKLTTKGPVFIYQSPANIDRLITMYKIFYNSQRIFYQDIYTSLVTISADKNIPNPKFFKNIKSFICFNDLTKTYKLNQYKYNIFRTLPNKSSIKNIKSPNIVMWVRPSMIRDLIFLSKNLNFKNGILVYSMWNGYKKEKYTSDFLEKCRNLGLKIIDIHTSGHADPETIDLLISKLSPKKIEPIHTENSKYFKEKYPELIK